jgi:ketosteroid isomerase-like protein
MMIATVDAVFGRDARSLLPQTRPEGPDGALAALETFYYAFNQRSLPTLEAIWADDALVQLNNPLGGILRGTAAIGDLYTRVFTGTARVWVEFTDIVAYTSTDTVVFAGRERGEFTVGATTVQLSIRTSRVFAHQAGIGWRQVHHHGSIDDADLLRTYQQAVASAAASGR